MELDNFDLLILEILQRNNMTPQRTIAEAVNLSPAAVQRRIKRMEEEGVIHANIAVIDPERVGRPLTLVVGVTVESEQVQLIDAAKKAFLAAKEVQQCYYVTGDADFILIVTVETMEEYEILTRRLFFDNPNVKRFQTFVTMDRVKVGLTVPI